VDVITGTIIGAGLLCALLLAYALCGLRDGRYTEERRILAAEARKRRELQAL
jgi:hypothetical protein